MFPTHSHPSSRISKPKPASGESVPRFRLPMVPSCFQVKGSNSLAKQAKPSLMDSQQRSADYASASQPRSTSPPSSSPFFLTCGKTTHLCRNPVQAPPQVSLISPGTIILPCSELPPYIDFYLWLTFTSFGSIFEIQINMEIDVLHAQNCIWFYIFLSACQFEIPWRQRLSLPLSLYLPLLCTERNHIRELMNTFCVPSIYQAQSCVLLYVFYIPFLLFDAHSSSAK